MLVLDDINVTHRRWLHPLPDQHLDSPCVEFERRVMRCTPSPSP